MGLGMTRNKLTSSATGTTGFIFSSGWLQFIVGVIVAVILVALVGRFFGERRRGALT